MKNESRVLPGVPVFNGSEVQLFTFVQRVQSVQSFNLFKAFNLLGALS
jgi:hypothetical protein